MTKIVAEQASYSRKFGLLTMDGTNVEAVLGNWFQRHGYRATTYHLAGFTLVLFEKVTFEKAS